MTHNIPIINWRSITGVEYKYWAYPLIPNLKNKGGNYIFAKRTVFGPHWIPVYIGQTNNLSERFDNHHKLEMAKNHGATHIHVHINENAKNRLKEESDLISFWRPICND